MLWLVLAYAAGVITTPLFFVIWVAFDTHLQMERLERVIALQRDRVDEAVTQELNTAEQLPVELEQQEELTAAPALERMDDVSDIPTAETLREWIEGGSSE